MILLNETLHELGEIECDIDAEVGTTSASTNDFKLNSNPFFAKDAAAFYVPGTEVGGIFEYSKNKTDQDYSTLKGYTWRGLMAMKIIVPPSGSNYKIVSGEANAIIRSMLSGMLDDFFTVSTESSGLTISNYQFPLYINMLDGLEEMLEQYNYRLQITAQKVASNQPIIIKVEAVKAQMIKGTYNEDNGIPMTFEIDKMGINHLICGGSGTLQNRMIRHLYIDSNGKVSNTQYYTGFEERQKFYDFANAESEDDLISNGKKRLLEIASHKTLTMKAPDDYNLDIGDIIQGVFPDGTIIRRPIVQKIYKISDGVLTCDYKVKGEE